MLATVSPSATLYGSLQKVFSATSRKAASEAGCYATRTRQAKQIIQKVNDGF